MRLYVNISSVKKSLWKNSAKMPSVEYALQSDPLFITVDSL